eukprot:67858_1
MSISGSQITFLIHGKVFALPKILNHLNDCTIVFKLESGHIFAIHMTKCQNVSGGYVLEHGCLLRSPDDIPNDVETEWSYYCEDPHEDNVAKIDDSDNYYYNNSVFKADDKNCEYGFGIIMSDQMQMCVSEHGKTLKQILQRNPTLTEKKELLVTVECIEVFSVIVV